MWHHHRRHPIESSPADRGLLLRADVHDLFDRGLIWIDEQFRVRVKAAAGHYEMARRETASTGQLGGPSGRRRAAGPPSGGGRDAVRPWPGIDLRETVYVGTCATGHEE
ncbi:hypothetical protein ACVMYR_08505 [Micromonospora sp. PTRAS2]